MKSLAFCCCIIFLNSYGQDSLKSPGEIQYSGNPNHREIVVKAFELALEKGFRDTVDITHNEILDRLEAGSYSEDFEEIPGIAGLHFPNPWDQGPWFDFSGYHPFLRIPYGSYLDTLSGWARGLFHGFDPVQGFNWPGCHSSTIEWADNFNNYFSWHNAVDLYQAGDKAEAYECLGHILHLLADLSVPSHVNVVNHGMSVLNINSGTVLDPDLLLLIVDEYEYALGGGLSIPGIVDFIPNLLNEFRSALNDANSSNIPSLTAWQDYFQELAEFTYNNNTADKYYNPPLQNGQFGITLKQNGDPAPVNQYFLTLPVQLSGRWAQFSLRSTAAIPNGGIIPSSALLSMCNSFVPKAVEYAAGLIMHFLNEVSITGIKNESVNSFSFNLYQNYPNPFNPETRIVYTVKDQEMSLKLTVYDVLGNEIAALLNENKSTGTYEIPFNGSGLPSGVYFYHLTITDKNNLVVFSGSKKMMLIK